VGWIGRALLLVCPLARIASLAMFTCFITAQAFAGDVWQFHPDSQQIAYSLRIGSSSGPAAYSFPEDQILQRRMCLIGAEITLQQDNFGQIGAGMDVMIGPRYPYSEDTLVYDFEVARYSAVFLYVSPGIQIQLGKDQPLSLGASVDIGPLWSRETSYAGWFSDRQYLEVERVLAYRPKFTMSYNLTHDVQLRFEYGWMHGRIRSAYFPDPDENWYAEYPRDYNGTYFGTSVAITRPIKRQGSKVFE